MLHGYHSVSSSTDIFDNRSRNNLMDLNLDSSVYSARTGVTDVQWFMTHQG
jgi:hypothetical protein